MKKKEVKTSEDLIALAKEYGADINQEQAAALLERLDKSQTVSEESLENVTGGCGLRDCPDCIRCGGTNTYSGWWGPIPYGYCRDCGIYF